MRDYDLFHKLTEHNERIENLEKSVRNCYRSTVVFSIAALSAFSFALGGLASDSKNVLTYGLLLGGASLVGAVSSLGRKFSSQARLHQETNLRNIAHSQLKNHYRLQKLIENGSERSSGLCGPEIGNIDCESAAEEVIGYLECHLGERSRLR